MNTETWQKLEEDPALMLQVRNEAQEWSEKVLEWARSQN
jgi:hypothetical protein